MVAYSQPFGADCLVKSIFYPSFFLLLAVQVAQTDR